ncbi:MBL fold metallo-hydrolase [Bacillus carboniphilus]|uniref:MBL fold metallo-hydrolase n=1 Tax=Bacillus carboniphilus TaxID=86663 RepID=A0ABY9JXB3_9BACI|nr:MBL fold metallo-hydrolase [Bacillus carboniphilus]WLR44005.1 MBL fold metallo-hydrolase [Bacillus carboniphilus]
MTHGDFDHTGEAIYLIKKFKVNHLIVPIGFDDSEWGSAIVSLAHQKKVNVTLLSAGAKIKGQVLTFDVLSPFQIADHKNNNSLVLNSKIGGYDWLFTGDIEEPLEKELVEKYNLQGIEILKIAHHGSETSTTEKFLEEIRPVRALISVGEKNRYGHPSSAVLERLEKYNAIIYQTNKHGSIEFRWQENRGTFYTYPP